MQNFGVTNKEHYAYVMIFSGVVNWPFAQLSQYTLFAPTPPKTLHNLCFTFGYYSRSKRIGSQKDHHVSRKLTTYPSPKLTPTKFTPSHLG